MRLCAVALWQLECLTGRSARRRTKPNPAGAERSQIPPAPNEAKSRRRRTKPNRAGTERSQIALAPSEATIVRVVGKESVVGLQETGDRFRPAPSEAKSRRRAERSQTAPRAPNEATVVGFVGKEAGIGRGDGFAPHERLPRRRTKPAAGSCTSSTGHAIMFGPRFPTRRGAVVRGTMSRYNPWIETDAPVGGGRDSLSPFDEPTPR